MWKNIFRGVILLMLAGGAMIMHLVMIIPAYASDARIVAAPSSGRDSRFTTQATNGSLSTCETKQICTFSGKGMTSERGTLSVSIDALAVNNGNPIIVMVQDQIIPFSFITHITDMRNSGMGWKLSASATAVDFGPHYPQSDMFLDPANPATAICALYPTCSSASALVLASGNQDLVHGPVTLANAPIASGLGSFDITAHGSLVIPANVLIGAVHGGNVSVVIEATP
jgi:hypothetical protein